MVLILFGRLFVLAWVVLSLLQCRMVFHRVQLCGPCYFHCICRPWLPSEESTVFPFTAMRVTVRSVSHHAKKTLFTATFVTPCPGSAGARSLVTLMRTSARENGWMEKDDSLVLSPCQMKMPAVMQGTPPCRIIIPG